MITAKVLEAVETYRRLRDVQLVTYRLEDQLSAIVPHLTLDERRAYDHLTALMNTEEARQQQQPPTQPLQPEPVRGYLP